MNAKEKNADLSEAERRAMNDFARFPNYRGGAADGNALVSLEKKGQKWTAGGAL